MENANQNRQSLVQKYRLGLLRRVICSLLVCLVGFLIVFCNHIDLGDAIVSEFNGIEQITSFITCLDAFFQKIKDTPAFETLVGLFVSDDQKSIVYSIMSLATISYLSFALDFFTEYKPIDSHPLVKILMFLLNVATNFLLTFVANQFLVLIFQHLPVFSIPASKPRITLPMSSDPTIRLLQTFGLNDIFELLVLIFYIMVVLFLLYVLVFKVIRKELMELVVLYLTFTFVLVYLKMTEMPIGWAILITAFIKSCVAPFFPEDEPPIGG